MHPHDDGVQTDLFSHHANTLRTLPRLRSDDALPAALTLGHFRGGVIQYAPFDFVNPTARLVLVGLTPGRLQAVNALNAAAEALRAGADLASARLAAKRTGSFSGPLRTNLVALLDHFGVQRLFGLGSCMDLFATHGELVHFTSALRYPVFNTDGSNYSRSPLAHPELERCVRGYFFAELQQLPTALFVPLGAGANEALALAVREGRVAADRVLDGLVHPSGANGERIAYQLGRKPRECLSAKVDATRIDADSARLRACMARLLDTAGRSEPVANLNTGNVSERTPVAANRFSTPTTTKHDSKEYPMPGFDTPRAEALLAQHFNRTATSTKYIAGFQTTRGFQLALERNRSGLICLWAEPTEIAINGIECKPYSTADTRNSNLNDKNASRLKTGRPAHYLKFADEATFKRFLEAYAQR